LTARSRDQTHPDALPRHRFANRPQPVSPDNDNDNDQDNDNDNDNDEPRHRGRAIGCDD
jgi:hypothetical protein